MMKITVRCSTCKEIITSGVTYKDEYYHRHCFTCTKCKKCLAGEKFLNRDNLPYCSECYEELFAEKCAGCNQKITGTGDIFFIFFDNRHWHSNCFNCVHCLKPLLGDLVMKTENGIVCTECGERRG